MTKIIGHRGARGLAPENTLASIQRAIDSDVDEVEVDVRISKDGIPVLSHDRILRKGLTGYSTSSHTLYELRRVKPNLATLQQAIELVAGKTVLLIEVKYGEPVEPVVSVIKKHVATAKQPAALLLGSKSQKALRELHHLLPHYPTVVIEPWSGIRAHYRARQVRTKRISMRSWWLYRGFLKYMHRRGYQVVPYTMNNPSKVARWHQYLYGIVTDFPDRYKK